jgi:hypothetical protein
MDFHRWRKISQIGRDYCAGNDQLGRSYNFRRINSVGDYHFHRRKLHIDFAR